MSEFKGIPTEEEIKLQMAYEEREKEKMWKALKTWAKDLDHVPLL